MITRRIVYILVFLSFASFVGAQGKTYYSKASGLAPNDKNSWNTNLDGISGSEPSDFTQGDNFIIQAGHVMTTTGAWILDNSNDLSGLLPVSLQIDGALVANHAINILNSAGGGNVFTLSLGGIYTHNITSNANLLNLFNNPTTVNNSGTININSTLTLPNKTFEFYNLNVNSNLTLSKSLILDNNLSIAPGVIFDLVTSTLSYNGSSVLTTSNTGKLKTKNTSPNPIPSSVAWSGTVEYYSTSNQTVVSGTYASLINSGSATNVLSGDIVITNLLTVSSGTFSLNGHNVTLKSTSISNTAQVDQVGGTINQSSGSFIVERYIPQGNRAYRDLGTTVYNSGTTIFSNWQESGSASPGYGIFITGKAGASAGVDATTGFDITQTGNPSMYNYVNGFWTNGLTATKSVTLDPYQAFRVLVRGDRSNSGTLFATQTAMTSATTLRTTGKIITGSVTYTSTGVTNTVASSTSSHLNAVDNSWFSMVTNPYPAAIDWNLITKNGLVSNFYYYYDPTIGTNGGIVTYDATSHTTTPSSNANQYIQPGQAFFVAGDGSTPTSSQSLVITESAKVVTPIHLTSVFGIDPPVSVNKIAVSLHKTVSGKEIMMDGVASVFSNNYSNDLKVNEDAFKLANTSENIAINRNNKYVCIEARKPITSNDSIPIKLWTLTNNIPYTIKIDGTHFNYPNTITPYLIDNYLNTKTELLIGDTTKVTFTPTTDPKTYSNRFVIVFAKQITPALAIKLTAKESNYKVTVDWTSSNENKLSYYALQRSTDGVNFSTISTISPLNSGSSNASYTYLDEDAPKTTNYYRVEAGNILDQVVLSSTAFVDLTVGSSKVSVYPNPITGNKFNLELDFVEAGTYNLNIYNQAGAIVQSQAIDHAGGRIISKTISINQSLSTGIYVIKLTNNKNEVFYNQKVIIGNK